MAEDETKRSPETKLPGPFEAEYLLETPARCPSCNRDIESVAVVRLLRVRVNFASTLPRRGYVVVCPRCYAILPAELKLI